MRQESGFSLIELIVAMTVTLIVSSAIYGLLTAGGNAFRREPEVADRQANIRAAMDMISRDVFAAGAGMPTFSQVFTLADPAAPCNAALNGCGPAGTMGAAAATARGGDSENTDVLEMLGADEQCSHASVCLNPGAAGTAATLVTREQRPQCIASPGLVLLVNSPAPPTNASFAIQPLVGTAGTTPCPDEPPIVGASPPNANFTFAAPLAPFNVGVWAPTDTVYLYRGRVVRYRIAPNPDPLDQAPSLWRTESGRFQPNGTPETEPGVAGFNPAGSPWQLVARGIEDMQIEYRDGNGAWANSPPVSLDATWATLVRQVRITLSARVSAANLSGESTGGGGAPDAVRGQLSTVVTPRAAFFELQMGSQIQ